MPANCLSDFLVKVSRTQLAFEVFGGPMCNNYHEQFLASLVDRASDFFGEHSPIEIVSNSMKLCDYDAATNSKFIAYSLIFLV